MSQQRTYWDCLRFATIKYGIEWYKLVTIVYIRRGRICDMWVLRAIAPKLTEQCQKQGNRLLGS